MKLDQAKDFIAEAPDATTPVAPHPGWIRGVRGVVEILATLALGCVFKNNSGETVPAAGNVWLGVQGHHKGGAVWYRRFILGPWEQKLLDIRAFDDVTIDVLGSSLPGFDVYAVFSSAPLETRQPDPLLQPFTLTVAGIYVVPQGAELLHVAASDGDFVWVCFDVDGVQVTVPDPAPAGSELTVKGVFFQTSIANFTGVWRLR